MAPTQVVFELESVEPDIFLVLNEGRAEVNERRVLGAPAWVIEVLSPTNREYNLETKRKLYARYGVVYWIVDPEAEKLLTWDVEGKVVYGRGDKAEVIRQRSRCCRGLGSSPPSCSTPLSKILSGELYEAFCNSPVCNVGSSSPKQL